MNAVACHAEWSASKVKHPCTGFLALTRNDKKRLKSHRRKARNWSQMLQSKPVYSYFVGVTQAKNFSTFLNKQCYGFASG